MVLRVKDNEDFPSDLLCLYCSLPENVCFIKTTNLDGKPTLVGRVDVLCYYQARRFETLAQGWAHALCGFNLAHRQHGMRVTPLKTKHGAALQARATSRSGARWTPRTRRHRRPRRCSACGVPWLASRPTPTCTTSPGASPTARPTVRAVLVAVLLVARAMAMQPKMQVWHAYAGLRRSSCTVVKGKSS